MGVHAGSERVYNAFYTHPQDTPDTPMKKHSPKLAWLVVFLLLSCRVVTGETPSVIPARPTEIIQPIQTVERSTPLPTQPGETPQPSVTVPPAPTAKPDEPSADYGPIARRHMLALSEEIGQRVAGTADEARAADYIQATLEAIGYTVERQPFSFGYGESENVIAVKLGLSEVEIIVGAHYDSVDAGKGADDNASGVGVMLEAAEWVWEVETPYTIRFIAFGAEEEGLYGSRHYVENMSRTEIKNTLVYINLDSVVAGDYTYMYGFAAGNAAGDAGPGSLHEWILELARAEGIDLRGKQASDLDEDDGTSCDCADYAPFQEIGIPFIYFEANNWEAGDKDGWTQVDPSNIPGDKPADGVIWHTKYDDLQWLDQHFPRRVDAHLKVFVTLLVKTLLLFS